MFHLVVQQVLILGDSDLVRVDSLDVDNRKTGLFGPRVHYVGNVETQSAVHFGLLSDTIFLIR
jgi:hypothetical protein